MAFAAIAGTTIAASYLDAKYGITRDIKTIMTRNAKSKTVPQIIELGKKGYGSAYLLVEDAARRWPNKEALVFQNRSWTFAQCEQEVGKLADWAQSQGLKQKGKPKLIVVSEDLLHIMEMDDFKIPIVEFRFSNKASKNNDDDNWNATTTRTKRLFLNELPKSDLNNFVRPNIKLHDAACYIYTSGTSGFPKAVEFLHLPFIYLEFTAPMRGISFDERRYCPLPLYHTSALALGLYPCWGVGATFIVGQKFSASKFWDECRTTNATSFQYIGEICRYLMLQPPSINDKNHKIRLVHGNGIRSDIWQAFRERFGIEIIVEVYGQTEAGSVLIENRNYGLFGLGAIGYRGPLLTLLDKSQVIVKFDFEKGIPYRDPKTGRCILAKVDELGEMIYQVDPNISRGYLNIPLREDPRNLLDVFKKGDFWRRMGDLLVLDKDGWYRFVDRVGNTFRWKGENISSQEVEKKLSAYPHIIETIVYGVPLKTYDGQVGMAALVLNPKDKNSIQKTMKELPRFLTSCGLPNFAIPRFIRLMDEMPTTVTYKYKTNQLRKEGIDRVLCGYDNLFILDHEQFIYMQLDENMYHKIKRGDAKL
ncbi:6914_t:CDS:10 [Ambispora gerdemannii]|uniref:6914_t:CDS:1 n=1 Tax=Ambispora gerdemannii TaxID=144530 RepID=A0A9N9F0U6_9GLOM|nr:6914_t:CDS:10 [Ambispora gerdemannii]